LTLGAGPAVSLTGRDLGDIRIDSASPFNAIRLRNLGPTPLAWNSVSSGGVSFSPDVTGNPAGPRSVITAPSVGMFLVSGYMSADLLLSNAAAPRTLGTLLATTAIADSNIHSAGNIGAIFSRSFSGDRIFAGVAADVDAAPVSAGDFANTAVRIASLRVIPGGSFSSTTVAAPNLGAIILGRVTTASSTGPFGVFTDQVMLVSGVDDSRRRIRIVRTTTSAAPGDQFRSGDFVIRLV
jgi:hypothetical protein